MSLVDVASLARWDDYTLAKEAMFFHTDTLDAPWTVIRSDDKKRGHINCMRHFLAAMDYNGARNRDIGYPDPKIVGTASKFTNPTTHKQID